MSVNKFNPQEFAGNILKVAGGLGYANTGLDQNQQGFQPSSVHVNGQQQPQQPWMPQQQPWNQQGNYGMGPSNYMGGALSNAFQHMMAKNNAKQQQEAQAAQNAQRQEAHATANKNVSTGMNISKDLNQIGRGLDPYKAQYLDKFFDVKQSDIDNATQAISKSKAKQLGMSRDMAIKAYIYQQKAGPHATSKDLRGLMNNVPGRNFDPGNKAHVKFRDMMHGKINANDARIAIAGQLSGPQGFTTGMNNVIKSINGGTAGEVSPEMSGGGVLSEYSNLVRAQMGSDSNTRKRYDNEAKFVNNVLSNKIGKNVSKEAVDRVKSLKRDGYSSDDITNIMYGQTHNVNVTDQDGNNISGDITKHINDRQKNYSQMDKDLSGQAKDFMLEHGLKPEVYGSQIKDLLQEAHGKYGPDYMKSDEFDDILYDKMKSDPGFLDNPHAGDLLHEEVDSRLEEQKNIHSVGGIAEDLGFDADKPDFREHTKKIYDIKKNALNGLTPGSARYKARESALNSVFDRMKEHDKKDNFNVTEILDRFADPKDGTLNSLFKNMHRGRNTGRKTDSYGNDIANRFSKSMSQAADGSTSRQDTRAMWNTLRDDLIKKELDGGKVDPATARYRAMKKFQQLKSRYNTPEEAHLDTFGDTPQTQEQAPPDPNRDPRREPEKEYTPEQQRAYQDLIDGGVSPETAKGTADNWHSKSNVSDSTGSEDNLNNLGQEVFDRANNGRNNQKPNPTDEAAIDDLPQGEPKPSEVPDTSEQTSEEIDPAYRGSDDADIPSNDSVNPDGTSIEESIKNDFTPMDDGQDTGTEDVGTEDTDNEYDYQKPKKERFGRDWKGVEQVQAEEANRRANPGVSEDIARNVGQAFGGANIEGIGGNQMDMGFNSQEPVTDQTQSNTSTPTNGTSYESRDIRKQPVTPINRGDGSNNGGATARTTMHRPAWVDTFANKVWSGAKGVGRGINNLAKGVGRTVLSPGPNNPVPTHGEPMHLSNLTGQISAFHPESEKGIPLPAGKEVQRTGTDKMDNHFDSTKPIINPGMTKNQSNWSSDLALSLLKLSSTEDTIERPVVINNKTKNLLVDSFSMIGAK